MKNSKPPLFKVDNAVLAFYGSKDGEDQRQLCGRGSEPCGAARTGAGNSGWGAQADRGQNPRGKKRISLLRAAAHPRHAMWSGACWWWCPPAF